MLICTPLWKNIHKDSITAFIRLQCTSSWIGIMNYNRVKTVDWTHLAKSMALTKYFGIRERRSWTFSWWDVLPLPCLSLALFEKFWEGQGHNETLLFDRVLNIQSAAWELVESDVTWMLLGQMGTFQTHALFLVLHRFFRPHQQILYALVIHLFGTNGDFQADHRCSKTSQWWHWTAWMVITFRWKKDVFQFSGFPSIPWVYTQFFGSTQYSCYLTACFPWQKNATQTT